MRDLNLSFNLRTVKEDEVMKVVKKLKNKTSHGFDNISAELIKLGGQSILKPLTWIINTSIVTGTFPEMWKVAKVTPLHKKEDKTLAKNYRPVSLLCVSGMVCERIIAIQVEKHFEDNNFFGDFQFGFRKKKSTVSELLTLFDRLMEAKEKKQEVALVLYDLSAAFDTVAPDILLEKLKLYGFNGQAMEWIKSYLSGRQQAVAVKGEVSSLLDIDIGTPQGSRLSPLLFVILMADLNLWIKRSHLTNFADDTQSIIIEESKEKLLRTVQEESQAVVSFFSGVNLVNNPDKAALLYNSKKKGEHIIIQGVGGETLSSKDSEKLLGMHISSSLDWGVHIDELCRTLNQRLGMLKRIKNKVNRDKLHIIAEAIFTSKIRYGLAVYSNPRTSEGESKDEDMKSLQVMQNDMLRVIYGHTRAEHINMKKLRAKTNMMSVNQLSTYHVVLEVYNVMYENSSSQLKYKMKPVQGYYKLRTEIDHKYRGELPVPERPSNNCVGFSYKGPTIWNKVPQDIRESTTKESFKRKLKRWIIANIPD